MRILINQFRGLTNKSHEPGGLFQAHNIRIKNSKIYTIPDPISLYSNIWSQNGLYVWGYGGDSKIVAFGNTKIDYNGNYFDNSNQRLIPVYTLLDYTQDKVTQFDLSPYGVSPNRRIPAVVMGDHLWFNAGSNLFMVALSASGATSTVPAGQPVMQPMTVGYESGTASYLVNPPDAKLMVAYKGRVFYAGLSNSLHSVTEAVTTNNVPKLAAITSKDAKWAYKPNQVVFSEPYQPNAIKVWSFIGIEDYEAEITGMVSWNHTLFIFTRRGVWGYTGDDPLTATMERIPDVDGCVNSDTIKIVGRTLFWVGPYGVNFMTTKGAGKVDGLDKLFGLDLVANDATTGQEFPYMDFSKLQAASSDNYGYYVLTTGTNEMILVDESSKQASIFQSNDIIPYAAVGVGQANIGGAYCDVILGVQNSAATDSISALLWDGGPGTSRVGMIIPDINKRITWRTADVSIYNMGRIVNPPAGQGMQIVVQDKESLAPPTSPLPAIKPRGWEDIDPITSDTSSGFRLSPLGTTSGSKLPTSSYAHFVSHVDVRSSSPVVGIFLETNRSVAIDSIVLDAGPEPASAPSAGILQGGG